MIALKHSPLCEPIRIQAKFISQSATREKKLSQAEINAEMEMLELEPSRLLKHLGRKDRIVKQPFS